MAIIFLLCRRVCKIYIHKKNQLLLFRFLFRGKCYL